MTEKGYVQPEVKDFIPEHIGCDEKGEEISGITVKEQPENIVVIVKFYKLEERENVLMCLIQKIKERNFQKPLYIVEGDEFVKEMNKYVVNESLFNDLGYQVITLELVDLISGNFVPIKMIINK